MNEIINKKIENVNRLVTEVEKTFGEVKKKNINISWKFPTKHKEHSKLLECSKSLYTTILQHKQTKDYKKNISFFACKSKFCPICNKIKTNKLSRVMYEKITQLQNEDAQKFLFLTLTVKNCQISELDKTIKKMNKAWRNLWRSHFDKENRFNGFIKFLEITFDKVGNAHPHFHILLSSDRKYFFKSNTNYLKTEDIAKLWQQVLKIDYTPIVDIRIIKPKKTKEGYIKKEAIPAVIAEMTKYPMKDTDYNKLNKDNMVILYNQLYRKRLIASGGNLKVSLAKVENSNQLNEVNNIEEWEKIAYIVMKYLKGGYAITSSGDYKI
jgi:plasmid rolling circle replication initiator protein Rep